MSITATDIPTIPAPKREWSRYRHPQSTIRFAAILAILAFLGWSVAFERPILARGALGRQVRERLLERLRHRRGGQQDEQQDEKSSKHPNSLYPRTGPRFHRCGPAAVN